MKIAVVLHEDRHTDPGLFLFEDPEEAIAFAKERAREFDRRGQLDETLTRPMTDAGWLYSASLGDDGGCLRVELCDVMERP